MFFGQLLTFAKAAAIDHIHHVPRRINRPYSAIFRGHCQRKQCQNQTLEMLATVAYR